ncbi:fimbrillin family protein [uncultured Bacteroides sp.]|jgi:hypothetical protein bacD2_07783|uniref:fimbrillin family protein n=1 Tax=uncultured Bacteroides sp. TaxID=162156 RepID=UPI00280A9B10|nr:fimbrillin family protein [uncultured Bacteroides sp.]
MKLKYLFLAAASTLAAACSETDEPVSGNSSRKTLETIQSGTDRFATRVNLNSEWEQGDAIGVYMLDAGTENIRNSAMNIQYNASLPEASPTTDFVAANGGIGIYDQPCDFIAYYPYSSGEEGKVDAGAGLYNVDLADQSAGISSHDLMWAKTENMSTEDLQGSGLSLTFHHQLALLRVHVKGDVTAESVTVSGLNTVATFDLLSGTLSEGNTSQSISLYKTSEENVFIGIMLPTDELRNKMKISITAGGKKYQYTVPENSTVEAFAAGFKYKYTINIENDEGSLEGGSGGNEPWEDGGSEEGKGDEVLDNEDIPEGYTQVFVEADADLTELLEENKAQERIALIFKEGEYTSGKITVPAEVKELLFISETETQVKLTLTGGVAWEGKTLEKLGFNNLEITGNGVQLVESCVFAEGGAFEIQKCYIHDIKDVLSIDNTPEEKITFLVDNSYVANAGNLFWRYRAEDIKVTNSTLYKMNVVARSGAINNVDVQNCTLVDFAATLFEDSGNLTFKNNIVACFTDAGDKNDNLTWKIKGLTEFSGNYAAKSVDSSLLPMIEDSGNAVDAERFPNAWTSLTMTQAELFDGDNEEGEFYTTITTAGDPRWRQEAQ